MANGLRWVIAGSGVHPFVTHPGKGFGARQVHSGAVLRKRPYLFLWQVNDRSHHVSIALEINRVGCGHEGSHETEEAPTA